MGKVSIGPVSPLHNNMIITPIKFDLSLINRGSDDSPRGSGLHLSAIIRDLDNRLINKGQRKPWNTLGSEEQRRGNTYQSMGFVWERVLERALAEQFEAGSIIRPGETTRDGIHCNPDLVDLSDETLEEWKCTWRSSRRADDLEGNFWAWLTQIKGYLYVLGLVRCRLRVFFVNGDYKDSGPQIMCFTLAFFQSELDENWAMLLAHAKSNGMFEAANGNQGSIT